MGKTSKFTGNFVPFQKARVYPEANIGYVYGIPEWIAKYPMADTLSYSGQTYTVFRDRNTSRPVPYHIDNQTNHALFVVGTARMSGKTTFLEFMIREEVKRGTFAIVFDIKGEYPNIDYEVPVKSVTLNSFDNPLKIKPSTLTQDDWNLLAEMYKFGKERSNAVSAILRAAEGLVEANLPLTLKNLKTFINNGYVVDIKQDSLVAVKIRSFFKYLEKLDFLSEDEGLDLIDIMRNYSCLIMQYPDYEERDLVSILVENVLRQLFKYKKMGDPKRADSLDYRDVWDRKVLVVIDEGGDSEIGLANRESPMKCYRAVEQLFTLYPYAKIVKIVSTQVPQNISTKILGNCPHLFIGRVTEENALKKLGNMGKLTRGDLLEILPYFHKGDFLWMHGDEISPVQVILPPDWTPVK